jgi:exodeoxyribonuclease VII small subunit
MINELSFEEAFDALKQTVTQLETEDLPLEEALNLFERGTKLSRHCEALLEQAELRIQQLVPSANGDRFDLAPFDEL